MLGINICNGRFEFGFKLGAGSFGNIYYGLDKKTGEEVAIKVETKTGGSRKSTMLEYEARLYKVLGPVPGIPAIHWFGSESGCNVMVMDLLGPSLQDLLRFMGGKFTLKTVLQLGHQMMNVLEYVHDCCFIHRDLKPGNFLVGRNDQMSQVKLIDFGLARKYWNTKTGTHIEFRQRRQRGIIGTARYASLNAHQGIELSRRDDLESVVYMLLQFSRGNLPWQNLQPRPMSNEEKNLRTALVKAEMQWEVLCEGLPAVFVTFLMLVHCLEFEEKPNYNLFRKVLSVTAAREGINFDGDFDWTETWREGGEMDANPDEDASEGRSGNLSEISADSVPADTLTEAICYTRSGNAGAGASAGGGVGSRQPRGEESAAAAAATGATVNVGPLLRMAASEMDGVDRVSQALALKMQSVGVTDAGFWDSVEQLYGDKAASKGV